MKRLARDIILILSIFSIPALSCAGSESPVFLAELPTPGEYVLFANGGWNGNWYVGYEHAWVTKLPPVGDLEYGKAYLGARLGRAKTREQISEIHGKQKTDIQPGPYSILIGVSRSEKEPPNKKYVLADTDELPMEGSPVMALENVSASRWFWVEIDSDLLSRETPNYIRVWSENSELDSAETSPILAGGVGSNKLDNSFLVIGSDDPDVKTIKYFEPAIAMKFVKKGAPVPRIEIKTFEQHPLDPMKQLVGTEVSGEYITEVGMQVKSGSGWEDTGRIVTGPPYDLVLSYKDLSPGEYQFRCWAKNWWESTGYSSVKTFRIEKQ
ncbi:MAG: hypothetical protein JXJ19_04125 [Elusimicrobia bacterium]|nr:hypothetical protein [Elusimicrobiota bacterium]